MRSDTGRCASNRPAARSAEPPPAYSASPARERASTGVSAQLPVDSHGGSATWARLSGQKSGIRISLQRFVDGILDIALRGVAKTRLPVPHNAIFIEDDISREGLNLEGQLNVAGEINVLGPVHVLRFYIGAPDILVLI